MDVIIAKDFNQVDEYIQIQVLEVRMHSRFFFFFFFFVSYIYLSTGSAHINHYCKYQLLRSKKLITETGVLYAPERNFLFVPLIVRDFGRLHPPLNPHLVCLSFILLFLS